MGTTLTSPSFCFGVSVTGCASTGPFSVCGVRIAPAFENPPGALTLSGMAMTLDDCAGCTREYTPHPPPATTNTIAAAAAARTAVPRIQSLPLPATEGQLSTC